MADFLEFTHYLMTNDPPGKLGWCQKCYKSVELKDKLKVD